jgi:hypothetical protein
MIFIRKAISLILLYKILNFNNITNNVSKKNCSLKVFLYLCRSNKQNYKNFHKLP